MLPNCEMDPWEQISFKFESNCQIFIYENAAEYIVS